MGRIGLEHESRDESLKEFPVLDVVYVLVVLAVFAVIGVVAWGVEKL
jgi:hypothetical protein